METLGRDKEKAKLKEFSYYRGEYEPHWRIIDIFHDWFERKLEPQVALTQLYAVIDARPTIAVLDTAGYWFRRAVATEPGFEAYVDWLASHQKSAVRVAAMQEMKEPRTPEDHARFERLLADRSKDVRRAVFGAVRYGRWLNALDALQTTVNNEADRAELAQLCDFVRNGFEREGVYVRFYSGKHPGGAGGITSAPESHYAHVPFERVARDELAYRIRTGVWPTRPEGDSSLEAFSRWRP